MKDSTKQNLDEFTADLVKVRKNNSLSYWSMLALIGLLISGGIMLILKTTGILLLVIAISMFLMNNALNAYLEMRKAERDAEDSARRAEAKRAKKEVPPPVVVEANKDKTVRINLK